MALFQTIADDIYQLTLPLPFALRSVNCYLVRDGSGWVIVDTGLNTPPARRQWQAVFAELNIRPQDIRQIMLTHSHPDHYGLAGWLQAWCSAPVLMSPREAKQVEQIFAQDNRATGVLGQALAGALSASDMAGIVDATRSVREKMLPHPTTIEPLSDGQTVTIGWRRFTAVHTPGHSDGHLIFYDAADRLALCGDQVLMKITPNIGQWSLTDPKPLARYLASLHRLKSLDVRIAWPGHGLPVTEWGRRLSELEMHHAHRLQLMADAVTAEGSTLYEICAAVFNLEKLSKHELRFAMAETMAHVD
ncbi:MAG: MBL fold metallo-hydrolase, partial [Anaerolineae bacterium]|nr:MBL fold metallo-hydrolase [Anaerolineae bacterium]